MVSSIGVRPVTGGGEMDGLDGWMDGCGDGWLEGSLEEEGRPDGRGCNGELDTLVGWLEG